MTGAARKPRRWLLAAAVAAAGVCGTFSAPGAEGQTLDPTSIPKYRTELVIPPVMPPTGKIRVPGEGLGDYYEIAVRQFTQQILPAGFPATTVWSYGSVNHPGTFHYPAFTIEAKVKRPVVVKWINELVDEQGNYRPHFLPVDQTLHWANPPGGPGGTDMAPDWGAAGFTPPPYTGPVPIVPHVHGAHTHDYSDGFTEAWWLPDAKNLPAGYARVGSDYETMREKSPLGHLWTPGSAVFEYPNDQQASTIWYHDHSLGMTRLNVYAGPAGFYLLRGGRADVGEGLLPGPAPKLGDPAGQRYYEIPLAIQDRSFNDDGALWYATSRADFDGITGPFVPFSDVSPFWNPEFFGNTMVVNGNTWPVLQVEPRRYRFRFLNGCDSRTLFLKIVTDPLATRPAQAAVPFWQIGSDGGFLPAPVQLNSLLLTLAERADCLVDFSQFPVGAELYLINEGPDEPFGEGMPVMDFEPANPETTGQVMKFVVGPRLSHDNSKPPSQVPLVPFKPLGPADMVRQVSLNELTSQFPDFVELGAPIAALLGTMDADGNPVPMRWMEEVTERPALNATEIWEIYNFTMDAHPIHLHEVQFQVVNRQPLVRDEEGMALAPAEFAGDPEPPLPWETGYKDTVLAYPGMVTRIKAFFDLPGLFVWHCHILSHEDNEMMRPLVVGTEEGMHPMERRRAKPLLFLPRPAPRPHRGGAR